MHARHELTKFRLALSAAIGSEIRKLLISQAARCPALFSI
jgi:hypothetical protein